MKQYLKPLLVAIGVAGLLVTSLYFSGRKLTGSIEKDAVQWTNKNLPAFLAKWDIGEFKKRCATEFLSRNDAASFDKSFVDLSQKLGPMKSYGGSKVLQIGEIKLDSGATTIAAQLMATAEFERGRAEISVHLVSKDERWQIGGFFPTVRGAGR